MFFSNLGLAEVYKCATGQVQFLREAHAGPKEPVTGGFHHILGQKLDGLYMFILEPDWWFGTIQVSEL